MVKSWGKTLPEGKVGCILPIDDTNNSLCGLAVVNTSRKIMFVHPINHGNKPIELCAGQPVEVLTLLVEDSNQEDLAMKVRAAWDIGNEYPE